MEGAGDLGDDHGHRAVYDASAEVWNRMRAGRFPEQHWMALLAEGMTPGSAVLDLGCGAGLPVAGWFADQGYTVTGMDFSAEMLALAKRAVPDARFLLADMRGLDLGCRFEAVVAWDSFFHLTGAEQRDVIGRVARHLMPDGHFLFTAGDHAGESWGAVSGGPVFHASLSPAGYALAFEEEGLILRRFVAQDPATAGRSVWLARKG